MIAAALPFRTRLLVSVSAPAIVPASHVVRGIHARGERRRVLFKPSPTIPPPPSSPEAPSGAGRGQGGSPGDVLSIARVGFELFCAMLFTWSAELARGGYAFAGSPASACDFASSSRMTHEPCLTWLRVCSAS